MTQTRDTLPALTSLRFFAALATVVLHLICLVSPPQGPSLSAEHWPLATGVTFFFVLSGFILTYTYLDHLRQPTARGVWNFVVARWARIYPVHVVAILLVLPLVWRAVRVGYFGSPVLLTTLHVTLLQAFGAEKSLHAFNIPAWSLSAEWFFYLCFPLLVPGLTTGSYARRSAVLLVALAPWLVGHAELLGLAKGWRAAGVDPYTFPPIRLADFVAGILLGLCWNRWGAVSRGRSLWATLVEVAAVLILAAWVCRCASHLSDSPDSLAYRWNGRCVPPFALVIWVFARGGGWLTRVLSARPLVYLGEISYATYMLHMPIITYCLTRGASVRFGAWPWQWRWAFVVATTLLFSAACYRLCELPLRDRLKRWLSIRPPAPADAPVAADVIPFPEVSRRRRAA